ncbi:MAG: hypothetical protein ACC707_17150, partial [Thiohalomonadales bacterium]
ILILSAVFLFVLVASSAHFYYRTTENTSMTGIARDSNKALLMAESAMEHLRGEFVQSRLNTDNTTRVTTCVDGGVTDDTCESAAIQGNMDNPTTKLFEYMYFISASNALENTTPQLLQRIANGESSLIAANQLTSNKIVAGTAQLRINDLFNSGASLQPRLYTLSANSRLTASAAADWDAEINPQKASAWIEVIVNPNNANAVDLIVQAVAQVGKSKNYMQRLVGSFSPPDTIGNISALTEASDVDRTL